MVRILNKIPTFAWQKIFFLYQNVLKIFYTFHHLVDSYRNTISEWAMGFRHGNFASKLVRGLIFGGEKISIPESRLIPKSYI